MVTHIVIFHWAAGVTRDEIDKFSKELERMAAHFVETATIRHGPDLAFREGNGDYALLATFTDKAAWRAYQEDARHKAFVRDFVAPLQASRVAIQI